MLGLMQDRPMLVSGILEHASKWHGMRECVSLGSTGEPHRQTYRETANRASRLAHALVEMGIGAGDAVGIIGMNSHRHLELWYALSGIGAIAHSINPRLSPDQIGFVIGDAADRLLFVDPMFVPLADQVCRDRSLTLPIISLADEGQSPEAVAQAYEALLAGRPDKFNWPLFDERTANAICHTSGTTGNPKGVRYSHRSNVLHAIAASHKDVLNLGATDVVLPMVPFFHANGWGMPYACLAYGASLIMPGAHLEGESLYRLMDQERVTIALGVPTICQSLLEYLRETGKRMPWLERIAIAGSAASQDMIEAFAEHRVEVVHAWGMTETSPVATANAETASTGSPPQAARLANKQKQGRPVFGIDITIRDDNGADLPHDGKAFGRLHVRGHWVLQRYHSIDTEAVDSDGWLDTGDVATIDPDGFMQITDRAKDLIKSGGEWISSVDLENAALSHPYVVGAAAIGVPHPKWDERPLLLIVPRDGIQVQANEMRQFLAKSVSKIWLPDDVIVVEELPLGATGKVQKAALRQQYRRHFSMA